MKKAQAEQFLVERANEQKRLKGHAGNVQLLCGASGGTSRRTYYCALCGQLVDTESACYPKTLHARTAITAHTDMHLANYERELGEPILGLVH